MNFKKAIEESRKSYEEMKKREEEYRLKHAHDECYVCEDCEKKRIREFLDVVYEWGYVTGEEKEIILKSYFDLEGED